MHCHLGEGSPFISTEHPVNYSSRTQEQRPLGMHVLLSLGERGRITSVQADASSLGNNSGCTAEQWRRKQSSQCRRTDMQASLGPQRRREPASPGRATSSIDHNCLSGSWLPLQLPNLPQPSSSICLSPSLWRPISATLSSTQPESTPQKLRVRHCYVFGLKCSSGTQDSTALSHRASFFSFFYNLFPFFKNTCVFFFKF